MKTKPTRILYVALIIAAFFTVTVSAQTGRSNLLFNSGWKFHKGDVDNGQAVDLMDADWRMLALPHDWSIEGPFSTDWASGTAFLPAGIGWYRKTFTLLAVSADRKTYIYFDGVNNNSTVWINGHELGKRPNGFVSFAYDMTPYLNVKAKNVIAVRVDHTKFADSRWYTGSGIYRNVYLITTDAVHVDTWGVFVATPKPTSAKAVVHLKTTVLNSGSKAQQVTLLTYIADAAGSTISSIKTIEPGKPAIFEQDITVKNPQLWNTDNPALYKAITRVLIRGKAVDTTTTPFGIRDIKFDPDKGFFLNGNNMKLKGVCIHDDAGVLGVAVPKEVWYRRLKTLKEGGCNALRFSHNPHVDYLYDLCDQLGFLVMDEAFDEWELGKNKWIKGWNAGQPGQDGYHDYFAEWADKDVRDMVLRDRNHPSIIMWSIGNEIDYPNDPYTDPILNTGRNPQIYGKGYTPSHPPASKLAEISKKLVADVKNYDTTRPVTSALAGVVMSNTTSFPENLDVVGYNYQEFRYATDHKLYPKRIIYGSENGMGLGAWNAVDSNAYIAGQYLWTGIDYLGEAHKWPEHASGSGLLDMAGFPKPEYYFRQSLWSDKPMVYLATTDKLPGEKTSPIPAWNYKPGDKVRVNCFTNCKEAELFLNGRSVGKKLLSQFKGRVIYWDVDYEPGELAVKGYADGKTVTYSLKTAGEPFAIIANEDLAAFDPQTGTSQIVVQVVDKNGVAVYSADNELTVKVTAPAKVIGMENGRLDNLEDYRSGSMKVLNGKLLIYVQPKNQRGTIQIDIQSPGLNPLQAVVLPWQPEPGPKPGK